MPPGIGLPEGVVAHFVDGRLSRVFDLGVGGRAYFVSRNNQSSPTGSPSEPLPTFRMQPTTLFSERLQTVPQETALRIQTEAGDYLCANRPDFNRHPKPLTLGV